MLTTLHYLVLALEVLIECYQFVKNNDLNNIDDCKMKCSSFIISFNKLHCNYANMQSCILSKLFK